MLTAREFMQRYVAVTETFSLIAQQKKDAQNAKFWAELAMNGMQALEHDPRFREPMN